MDYIITSRDRHESPEHKRKWEKIDRFYKSIKEDIANTPKTFRVAPALHGGIYSNNTRVNYPQRKPGDDTALVIVEINDITEIKVWEQLNDKSVDQRHIYGFQLLLEWTTGKIEIILDDEDEADFIQRKVIIDAGILKREAEIRKANQPIAYLEELVRSCMKRIEELETAKVKVK